MDGQTPGAARSERRFFVALVAAAAISRLIWAIWVHPAPDHVYSDMAHYVFRARELAEHGFVPGTRSLAWQAWGTHVLLAIPMILLGPDGSAALELAGLIWAGCSAATVILGYRLAQRSHTGDSPWPPRIVGVALLLWIPLLSHTGYFVSETPFTCVLLATTLGAAKMIQEGRGALAAGCWGAVAFALRPQVAVFFVLLALLWLVDRHALGRSTTPRWSSRVSPRLALIFAIPLLLMLAFSMARFRVHTGRWGGVAENANMNLTAGRCHNIVTRAFPSEADMLAVPDPADTGAGRRVSLPGFRALAGHGDDHPLALRPALGGESIDFVGSIGDPEIHREFRRRCLAATGVVGQLRYSLVNASLSWVVARPWPESSDHRSPWALPLAQRGRQLAALLALPALLAMVLVLWRLLRQGREPVLALSALQLLTMVVVAAVFFGSPRLRTPSDPYALILLILLVGERGLIAVRGSASRR